MSELTAERYLSNIGFDDSHLPDMFNDDDKCYYKVTELMESYFEARMQANGVSDTHEQALPINSVMPRLIIHGIEFNKPDKDNETEIVVPSHGYDDDNHIWLTIDELKQIGEFYFNGA